MTPTARCKKHPRYRGARVPRVSCAGCERVWGAAHTPPPQTCGEMLDHIDRFLCERRRGDARRLWQVLTALRGPDNGDRLLKLRTTAALRSAAFPRLADKAVFFQPAQFADAASYQAPAGPGSDLWHFTAHVRMAAAALRELGRL